MPVEIGDADELATWFRSTAGAVRLLGSTDPGHRAEGLPDPPPDARLLHFSGTGIEDLSPGDLTCTVGAATTRRELDAELEPLGLELACEGEGSLAGLFARGRHRHRSPPRSQLLGLEGVCSDGRRFRSGARVVKSVAGFDLHKPFVGSRGRLFAATRLFLRLRPTPPTAAAAFASEPLPLLEACALFDRLRRGPALRTLRLCGAGTEAYVDGESTRSRVPDGTRDIGRWHEGEPESAGRALLESHALLSDLPSLLDALPAATPFRLWGTGALELSPREDSVQACLTVLQGMGLGGLVLRSGNGQGGLATPTGTTLAGLEQRVRSAFDPEGRLQ